MNRAEAGKLLGRASMFDNRKPSAGAADAWAEALEDVPLDEDALSAVAAYYGAAGEPTERRWLQPHHVRHYRNLARSGRIRDANLVYDGQPEESGAESAENLRALVEAAGSGQVAPRPIRAALEPGKAKAISGRKKAMLEAVGQHVPSRRAGVVNVLGVGCPHCQARPGQLCTSGTKRKRRHADAHPARLDHARRVAAGTEPDGAS